MLPNINVVYVPNRHIYDIKAFFVDDSYVKSSAELFKERKAAILDGLNVEKLENSLIKSIKGKNFAYSHKELTKIVIELGLNANAMKSVLVEQLLHIKKTNDQNMA